MHREHESMSPRLQEVSRYVMDYPQSVAFDTLAVIAKAAGVHASTLVRFANYFGFAGFSDVQRLFKAQMIAQSSDYADRIRKLQDSLGEDTGAGAHVLLNDFVQANVMSLEQLRNQSSPEVLEAAIDLMDAAREVYVVGVRRASPVVSYFEYTLSHVHVRCTPIDFTAAMQRERLSHIGEEDLIIGITYRPYANETREVLEEAKNRGAKVLLICDSELAPQAQLADLVLPVQDAEVRSFRFLNSTMCLAQTLCIGLAFRREAKA